MKRNILYIAAVACLTLGFSSCSDDPLDASSKHVYGEDESPYLRTDENATVDITSTFTVGSITPQTVYLKDYAELIQTNLKMTVDDAIAAIETGAVVFAPINSSLNAWNKTAPTKGTTGWYFNSAGGICTESDQVVSIELDKTNKCIVINAPENTKSGLDLSLSIGFALNNGKNYDDYVLFRVAFTTQEAVMVQYTATIPAGDYSYAELPLDDFKDEIESTFGMTIDEFIEVCDDYTDDGLFAMYVVNSAGEWDTTSSYTATGIGYWFTDTGKICAWNDEGFTFYIEAHSEDRSLYLGRYSDASSGTSFVLRVAYVLKSDPSKYLNFEITYNFE